MIKLLMIMLWAAFLFVFGTNVGAEEPADISSLAEDYGANDTADSLPYDAAEFLRENNISPDDPEGRERTLWKSLRRNISVYFPEMKCA